MKTIDVLHKPSNTPLSLNVDYVSSDIIFIENIFECDCMADCLHETKKVDKCDVCGVVNHEAADARLADWVVANGMHELDQCEAGLAEFLESPLIERLS